MRLSTRGRYGLKAMFQLSLYYGEGPIPLKQIADKQGLSENYLEQLFSILRKEGLVKSVRGAQGGYMLSREPKEITVGQVLRCLEGNMAPSDCVIDGEEIECEREEICVTKLVWIKIKDSIDEVIDSITLQDMKNDADQISKI
jgi:Rrf2 family protein